MKRLTMGLLLGATMMTLVGCGSEISEEEIEAEASLRKLEAKEMAEHEIEEIGEETDFSETYIGYYQDSMNKRDYTIMMVGETRVIVKERLKDRDIKEEDLNIEELDIMLENEIMKDLDMIQEQQPQYYHEEEQIEAVPLNVQHDMDGREINEDLNGYIYNKFPGCKGGDMLIEGEKVYKNVYDENGSCVAKIEMDYLTTGIIRVCE